MINIDLNAVYELSEVGQILSKSKKTIRHWIRAGEMPARLVGDRYVVSGENLYAYLLGPDILPVARNCEELAMDILFSARPDLRKLFSGKLSAFIMEGYSNYSRAAWLLSIFIFLAEMDAIKKTGGSL